MLNRLVISFPSKHSSPSGAFGNTENSKVRGLKGALVTQVDFIILRICYYYFCKLKRKGRRMRGGGIFNGRQRTSTDVIHYRIMTYESPRMYFVLFRW